LVTDSARLVSPEATSQGKSVCLEINRLDAKSKLKTIVYTMSITIGQFYNEKISEICIESHVCISRLLSVIHGQSSRQTPWSKYKSLKEILEWKQLVQLSGEPLQVLQVSLQLVHTPSASSKVPGGQSEAHRCYSVRSFVKAKISPEVGQESH